MNKKLAPILTGVMLILVGLGILFHEMNIYYFEWSKTWPIILIIIAIFSFIKVLAGQKKEIFSAVFFATLGVFFVLRNYGFIYDYWFDEFWPIFLIAPGLGFIGLFIVNPKDWGALIPGVALLTIGSFFTLEQFDIFENFVEITEVYWPLVLVLAGILLVIFSLKQDHKQHDVNDS